MAFIDNPTIAALGGALGLSPLFEAASGGADSSGATGAPPSAPKPGVTKPNVPAYRDRPYIPRNESVGGAGGVTPGGSNPTTPGTMDPATLQSPQVAPMLAQYGVTPPTTPPDPNLFIHNPEAFNRHPIMAGMLERGLEGLAFSHPGENWLQSLVGGVRGMGEANAARSAQVNAQVQAPLQQAQQIAALQHLGDQHREIQDNIDYHSGLLQHYHDADATRSERLAAMPPKYDPKTGQPSYLKETSKDHFEYVPDDNWKEDPQTAITRQYYENKKAELINTIDPATKQPYGSLDKVPPELLTKALQEYQTSMSLGKGAASIQNTNTRAAATKAAAAIRANASGKNGNLTPQQKGQIAEYNRQDAEDNKIVSGIESGSSPTVKDENGKIVYSGSPAAQAYRERVKQRIAGRAAQKAKILNMPASTTDTPLQAPQFSPGNPFAPKS